MFGLCPLLCLHLLLFKIQLRIVARELFELDEEVPQGQFESSWVAVILK